MPAGCIYDGYAYMAAMLEGMIFLPACFFRNGLNDNAGMFWLVVPRGVSLPFQCFR